MERSGMPKWPNQEKSYEYPQMDIFSLLLFFVSWYNSENLKKNFIWEMGPWYMLLFSCHSLFNSKYESIWATFEILKQRCCSSVTKPWQTLWDLMDGNTPGSSVLHCLMEFVQIHVHWVGDTIQYLILCCQSSCFQEASFLEENLWPT